LTGRENIFLNGAILGMSRVEIKQKFEEIVAFSEIQRFLDTPVKRYSSGMYVRLAFSVAAHLEPEILLIDEVLAVGDAAFQKKCLGKMDDIAQQGRTVLFVSHNMSAVNNLCQQGIVLHDGKFLLQDRADAAIKCYLEYLGEKYVTQEGTVSFGENPDLPAQLTGISIRDKSGKIENTIQYQDGFQIELAITVRKPDRDYYAIIYLTDAVGNRVIFTSDADMKPSVVAGMAPGMCNYRLTFPEKILKPGTYSVTANLTRKYARSIDRYESALKLTIEDNTSWRSQTNGYRSNAIIAPEINWDVYKE